MYVIHYCNIPKVGHIFTNLFLSQFRIVIALFTSCVVALRLSVTLR